MPAMPRNHEPRSPKAGEATQSLRRRLQEANLENLVGKISSFLLIAHMLHHEVKWWVRPNLNRSQVVPNHLGWTKLPHGPKKPVGAARYCDDLTSKFATCGVCARLLSERAPRLPAARPADAQRKIGGSESKSTRRAA